MVNEINVAQRTEIKSRRLSNCTKGERNYRGLSHE